MYNLNSNKIPIDILLLLETMFVKIIFNSINFEIIKMRLIFVFLVIIWELRFFVHCISMYKYFILRYRIFS